MTSPRALFIGRATLDVVYSLDQFPAEDTKTFARAMHVAPGGPATNAAITHALLGGQATLMTAVGGGPWAERVRDELRLTGVGLVDLAAGTDCETPLTFVLVNETGATRTIVNPPRSRTGLHHPNVWDPAWGEPPGVALTDGFHLDETLPLLRSLRELGVEICFDGGSWKPGTDDAASLLTVAICSERFGVPEQASGPEAVTDWFAKRGVPYVAVTRGAKPIVGWERGRRFEIEIAKIDAVDTTGAGDVLHGAFCYHFAQSRDFEGALRLASEVATLSCCGLGIRGIARTGRNL